MQSIPVYIPKWALWQDHAEYPTLMTHMSNGQPTGIDKKDLARGIAPAWRRRLDLFGRASAEVLGRVLEGASTDDVRNTRVVFASRHGNIERTLKLLGQIAREEIPSPADFSMSVHNALVGVASINWAITQSHSAISAGNDSFVAALTEALSQLSDDPHSPVAIVYIDLALPDVYAQNDPEGTRGTAFAMIMTSPLANTATTPAPGAAFCFEPRPVAPDEVAPQPPFARTHARMMADFLKNNHPCDTPPSPPAPTSCLLAGRSFAWHMVRNG
ncbi:beta-ketoacyl synthase chain length factor [Thalassospira sp. NFXS8]|uniref:beta-ketoacyl synthase chain length factor n=1 Tax=Thalassospira sp. NFXS8 TaxID=2819093 RepID=UPI0032DE32F3